MARETLQTLSDKAAINEAIAMWAYTGDGKDADGRANLFAEDGVLDIFFRDNWDQPGRSTVSREAIRALYAQAFATMKVQWRHHQSNTVFTDLTADTARTRTMVLFTTQEAEEALPHVAGSGLYVDEWRKTASGWKFARRANYSDT